MFFPFYLEIARPFVAQELKCEMKRFIWHQSSIEFTLIHSHHYFMIHKGVCLDTYPLELQRKSPDFFSKKAKLIQRDI